MTTADASTRWPPSSDSTSLDASDEFEELPGLAHYCPTQLLSAFALLMAGHGRSVNMAMMLGDHEYAIWQLARAHTLDDLPLHEIAVKLFAYFDDRLGPHPRN